MGNRKKRKLCDRSSSDKQTSDLTTEPATHVKKSLKTTNTSGTSSASANCISHPSSDDLIPFVYQYALLSSLQNALETMCQAFGQKWCPERMKRKQWTAKGSMELTAWISFIRTSPPDIPTEAFETPNHARDPMLTAVAQIRHNAVHRQSQQTSNLLQSIQAAIAFARLHRDHVVATRIAQLAASVQRVVDELSSQNQKICNIENALTRGFDQLQQKRLSFLDEAGKLISVASRALGPHLLNASTSNPPSCRSLERLEFDPITDGQTVCGGAPIFEIEQRFDPQGSLQLMKLKVCRPFVCTKCHEQARSKFVAYALTDSGLCLPVCNRCYGRLLHVPGRQESES